MLPAVHLLERGLTLRYLTVPAAAVDNDVIGVIFSGDEENTLALLRKEIVVAGGISSTDFESLAPSIKEELRIIAETHSLPRKLVSLRPGFDELPRPDLIKLLLAIDDADRKQMAAANGWNWEFEELGAEVQSGIDAASAMITQLNQEPAIE